MSINPNKITYTEFLELDNKSENLMEFIDGEVYGVEEYWIISPKNKDIQIFNLDENVFYGEPSTFYGDSIAISISIVFQALRVSLKDLFDN